MPKRNKKKRRKKQSGNGGGGGGAGMVAGAVGNVLGNMLGQLLADGLETWGSQAGSGNGQDRQDDDTAARVLKVLSERGPQSIAQLLEATNVGLTPLLGALRNVQEFRLIEFVGEGELVQLTQSGHRTVTVVQKDDIRREAARKLLP